jgi:hypothetical protein
MSAMVEHIGAKVIQRIELNKIAILASANGTELISELYLGL